MTSRLEVAAVQYRIALQHEAQAMAVVAELSDQIRAAQQVHADANLQVRMAERALADAARAEVADEEVAS